MHPSSHRGPRGCAVLSTQLCQLPATPRLAVDTVLSSCPVTEQSPFKVSFVFCQCECPPGVTVEFNRYPKGLSFRLLKRAARLGIRSPFFLSVMMWILSVKGNFSSIFGFVHCRSISDKPTHSTHQCPWNCPFLFSVCCCWHH